MGGPVLGGALADAGLWRYIFFINIPLGVAALIMLWFKVNESRDENSDGKLDLPGVIAIVLGLALLASVLTESMADHAAEKLSGKTIRDVLPKQRQHIPVADADDTIIEVAEVMARLRSPLVAVVKDNKLHGVITASRLLAAALNEKVTG